MAKTKKSFWFEHKGLPIAALSLVFLLVFLLVTINLTPVNQEDESDNVQGVAVKKNENRAAKAKAKTTRNNKDTQAKKNETSAINSAIRDIDNFLRTNNALSDNLNDIQQ